MNKRDGKLDTIKFCMEVFDVLNNNLYLDFSYG